MLVVFRADASLQMGTGHIMRCLTLAEALKKQGAEIEFICREHEGNLIERIEQQGFKVHVLPLSQNTAIDDGLYGSKWLGSSQEEDAVLCKSILGGIKADWLIVDHYGLDQIWESLLEQFPDKLMVIDDLANRLHRCDLLLDQNLFKDKKNRYAGKLPEGCITLLGPKYALLQSEYIEFSKNVALRKYPLKRLMISFGGTDNHNITELTLLALERVVIPFKRVDVVLSKRSPNFFRIKEYLEPKKDMQLHSDLPTLAPLMAQSDLIIGAGGATTWERCCLGLPSLVVTVAKNQELLNDDLYKLGLIELLGEAGKVTLTDISSAIEAVLSRRDIQRWSKRCRSICLGTGVKMVVDVMLKINAKIGVGAK